MKIVRRYYSGGLVVLENSGGPFTLTNLDALTVAVMREPPIDPALLPVYNVLSARMTALRDIIDEELRQDSLAYRRPFIRVLFEEVTRITDDWRWLRARIPDSPSYELAKAAVLGGHVYL